MIKFLNSAAGNTRAFVILTLLCAITFLPGQLGLPTMDRDEGRFAQATAQMLESGDYIVPHFQDEPRSKKPVGIYWLQAASVSATTGVEAREIWAYRIPSMIGAYLAVLLTFAIGSTLFDRRVGLAGGIMMAVSLVLVGEAHLAKTDAVLLATILLSMWGFALADRRVAALKPIPGNWGPALAFWIGLALSVLIKGPVGPAVILLTAITVTIMRRDLRIWKTLRPLRGLLLFLIVVAPWPLALLVSGEFNFIAESAGEDLLPKLFSAQEQHGGLPGTYLLALYPTFWPVSLVVIPAMVAAWRHLHDEGVTFCLAWWIPAWIMFELVPTKLPHYVLPLYPALALLAAKMVMDGWAVVGGRISGFFLKLHVVVWAVLSLVLAGGAVGAAWEFGQGAGAFWPGVLLAAIVLVGGGYAVRAGWRRAWSRSFVAAVLTMVAFVPALGFLYVERLQGIWITKQIVAQLPPAADRPALASTGYREPSLVFQAGTDTDLTWPVNAADYLAKTEGAYAFVERREAQAFEAQLGKLGFAPEVVAEVKGLNYSNGDDIDGHLYLHPAKAVAQPVEPAPSPTAEPAPTEPAPTAPSAPTDREETSQPASAASPAEATDEEVADDDATDEEAMGASAEKDTAADDTALDDAAEDPAASGAAEPAAKISEDAASDQPSPDGAVSEEAGSEASTSDATSSDAPSSDATVTQTEPASMSAPDDAAKPQPDSKAESEPGPETKEDTQKEPAADAADEEQPSEPQKESAVTAAGFAFAHLEGSEWQLVALDGDAVDTDIETTLAIDERLKLSGTTGCNRYISRAEPGDAPGAVTFVPLASTRMACPGPRLRREQSFAGAMGEVTHARLEEGNLILSGMDGRPLLTFVLMPDEQSEGEQSEGEQGEASDGGEASRSDETSSDRSATKGDQQEPDGASKTPDAAPADPESQSKPETQSQSGSEAL